MSRVHHILRLCQAADAFCLNLSHHMFCVPPPPPLSFIEHVYENLRRKAKSICVLPKLAHATLVSESSRHDVETSNTPEIIQQTSGTSDSPRRDSCLVQEAVTHCLVLVMENLVNQSLSKVAQDINMASKTQDFENSKVQLLKL